MIKQEHLDLLADLYTDTNPHSGAALLDHLRGTHDLLESWGNVSHVCLAGLFHSIYGTESYRTESVSFEDREKIRHVIGEEAEQLAFLFCVTRRRTFFELIGDPRPSLYNRISNLQVEVTPELIRDLIEMQIANYVEFLPRLDFTHEELDDLRDRVELAKDLITLLAYQAVTARFRKSPCRSPVEIGRQHPQPSPLSRR